MSVLILSGSLNPQSNSRLLARAAAQECERRGIEVTFADLRDYPLPLCDGASAYADPNVSLLGELIKKAKAVIVAVPIYNYYGNAAVKNVVELTGGAWEDKTVAFLCAAGGQSSYMSVMALANQLMLDFRCLIVPRFVYATDAAFGEEKVTDHKVLERVHRLVLELHSLSSYKPQGD